MSSGIKFHTKQEARSKLAGMADLVEAIGIAEQNKQTRIDSALHNVNNINTAITNTSDVTTLENLVTVINQDASLYSTDSMTSAVSGNAKRKAELKKEKIEHYRATIDDMASRYLGGTGGHKGYQYLNNPQDFKYYDYFYISKELERVNDFKRIFEDSEYDINSYNNTSIRTDNLKARIESYEQQLLAGLEATRGDNLITDNELMYIFTGDVDGLKAARTSNLQGLNTQKGKNITAISAIKKNIASIQKHAINESLKGNIFNDLKDYGMANMEILRETFVTKWQSNSNLQNEEMEDYIGRMMAEELLKNPNLVLKQYRNEILAYEEMNKMIDKEIFKWRGQDITGFDTTATGQSMQSDMRKAVFGTTETVTPTSINEIPLDLVSVPEDEDYYYSQNSGKYYDKEAVDKLRGD